MHSRDKKDHQLGMSYGTASHRLKKQILFSLVQETGKDICYRCGKVIETAEELSVDHKIDWLDKDPSLFWDLDNIAFSHLSCNIEHSVSYHGGRGSHRLLSRKEASEVKKRLADGDYYTFETLGQRFGVNKTVISNIAQGKTYTDVPGGPVKKGKYRPNLKLTYEDVVNIKRTLVTDPDMSYIGIANQFGVSEYTISDIALGRTWADVIVAGWRPSAKSYNTGAIINEDDVREIRRRVRSGESRANIAKDFPISYAAVCRAASGESWGYVE
jgi:hypothetical protein